MSRLGVSDLRIINPCPLSVANVLAHLLDSVGRKQTTAIAVVLTASLWCFSFHVSYQALRSTSCLLHAGCRQCKNPAKTPQNSKTIAKLHGQQLAQDRKMAAAAMGRVCAEVACVWRGGLWPSERARTEHRRHRRQNREVIPDSGSHTKKKKRTNGSRETT